MLILECLKAEQQPPDDAKLWMLCVLSKDRGEPGLEVRLRVRVIWSQVTVGGISPAMTKRLQTRDGGAGEQCPVSLATERSSPVTQCLLALLLYFPP